MEACPALVDLQETKKLLYVGKYIVPAKRVSGIFDANGNPLSLPCTMYLCGTHPAFQDQKTERIVGDWLGKKMSDTSFYAL